MSTQGTIEPTLSRLSNYIRTQYNCSFDFQEAESLRYELTARLNKIVNENAHVVEGNWVFFPIFIERQLKGVARISKPHNLDESVLENLQKIIQAVFEGRLESIAALHNLDFLEENLKSALSAQEYNAKENAKILEISKFRKNDFPFPEKSANPPFNFPFFIEALDPEDIFKMAVEIHTRSERYAFVSIQDVNPDVFVKIESIQALGEMTVFIPDVAALTPQQQQQVACYYDGVRDKTGPQFIAGTTENFAKLKADPNMNTEFLSYLMIGYLRLRKPFRDYKRENILEFFFDSLSGRTYHE